ncbi:MAG: FG-GAP-like repeat-containing protein, partial [Vitreimonas sp.]
EQTFFLFHSNYHINAGEEIHFDGLRFAFIWVDDPSLFGDDDPVAVITNDGLVTVTAHTNVFGASAELVNNAGGVWIVELVGEDLSSDLDHIAGAVSNYGMLNYGFIEVRSAGGAWGASDLSHFENHGTFRVITEGSAIGITAFPNGTDFINTGLFEVIGASATGYSIVTPGAFMNTGVFRVEATVGVSVGIEFGFNGQTLVIVNSGIIDGGTYAIIGDGDGALWGVADVQNTGEIHGIIDLGRGDDRIVNQGLMTGHMMLGAGNDQYLGADGQHTGANIWGDAGNDTVIAGVGADLLYGVSGDDTLDGGAGADTLSGGDGQDILRGGGDVDHALYAIASASATWTRNVNGTWTVTGEGTDSLTNVEFLSFTDRDVFLDRAARSFSGIGNSDILLRRSVGIMALWEVTGASIVAASFLPTAGAGWTPLGTGDFSGDGRDDVLWQRSDGLVYTWHMNGGAVESANAITGIGAEWSFLGVGDFNGDLKDDIAWQRNDGIVFIWQMNGAAIGSANSVNGLSADWQIAGFGDFNSDGRDDFLWRNESTGQAVIWHMNGSTIQGSGATSQQATLDWSIVGVGDTNGDGRDDIVMQRASDGLISVWAMDGTNVLSATDVAAANPAEWTVRGVGDYNGDGRDDILWQNDNGLVFVWLMNGATIQSSGALSGIGGDWSII